MTLTPAGDVEDMAACLRASYLDCTYGESLRVLQLAASYPRARGGFLNHYALDRDKWMRAAQDAIDHRPYMEARRAERAARLYHFLGAEAETADAQ